MITITIKEGWVWNMILHEQYNYKTKCGRLYTGGGQYCHMWADIMEGP